jgi:hypothetical protein
MKLLVCLECQDVFNLRYETKACSCGKSSGKYFEDGLHAEYQGPCLPLGFANSSFIKALKEQPQRDWGKEFTAFVIQKECPTMKRNGPEPKINLETPEERMLRLMSEVLHPPLSEKKIKARKKKAK